MPRINHSPTVFQIYNPQLRQQSYRSFNWQHLHHIAKNLATSLNALHVRGYVMGDVNQKNILVASNALVTLVDTDSFQVCDRSQGLTYRCSVGVPEYTPPELQGVNLGSVDREPYHDCFGLAIIIFQLLMEGFHPFTGAPKNPVYSLPGEVYLQCIKQGIFPYQPNKHFGPPPSAPDFSVLHPDIQGMFIRCYVNGHKLPSVRPTARQWIDVLDRSEKQLVRCKKDKSHWYSNHASTCHWCEREKKRNIPIQQPFDVPIAPVRRQPPATHHPVCVPTGNAANPQWTANSPLPWIGVFVALAVGLFLVLALFNRLCYIPYQAGNYIAWNDGPIAWGRALGILVGFIAGIAIPIAIAKDGFQSLLGAILACLFLIPIGLAIGPLVGMGAGMLVALIVTGILPFLLGIALGIAGGALLAIAVGSITNRNEMEAGCWLGGILGGILAGVAWGTSNRFLADALFLPLFAWAGYGGVNALNGSLSGVPALQNPRVRWLALGYFGLFVLGAFAPTVVFVLLVVAGLAAVVLLIFLDRTWQHVFAGTGCVAAPLLGALIGSAGSGMLDQLQNRVETTPQASENRLASSASQPGHTGLGMKTSGEVVTNSIGMKLVSIPAGEFQMGAPGGEYKAFSDERPQHSVRITRPFYLGVYEVTQAEYEQVMGTNPSEFKYTHSNMLVNGLLPDRDTGQFPVDSVSWNEAVEFCRRLSAFSEEKAAGHMYRLPTEAEWEYACRAGTTTPFHFGSQLNGREANSDGAAYGTPQKGPNLHRSTKVGSYAPNAFGLYDMHGNVNEWCEDWDGPYTLATVSDPTGPASGSMRVFRGGSWKDWSGNCRSAARNKHSPGSQGSLLGFRVAMTPGSPSSNSISNSSPVVEPPPAPVAQQVPYGSRVAFRRSGRTSRARSPNAPTAPIPGNNTAALSLAGRDPRTSTGLIAFVSEEGRQRALFHMKPNGGDVRNLTDQLSPVFAPVWSPDGTKLLFRGDREGNFYIIEKDGKNPKKILDCHEVAGDFHQSPSSRLNAAGSWLPDSKTVAVCAGSWPDSSKVYLITLAGLERTSLPLAKAVWHPVWSSDGTRIAFKTFNSTTGSRSHPFQVWVADTKGTQKAAVSGECDVQAGPLWLPDCNKLVFVKHGAWTNGRQDNKLCLKNMDNGDLSETDFAWDVATLVASPDGQKIAFSPKDSPVHVYVFLLSGTIWRQVAIIENGRSPCWSPDSNAIAFVSSEDQQIWLANTDGTGQVQLTSTPGRKGSPDWSSTAEPLGDLISRSENKGTPSKLPHSQDGSEERSGKTGADTATGNRPQNEPLHPKAPSLHTEKSRVDESREKEQPNTLPLSGRWSEAAGAEFSIEDDGKTISMSLLKRTSRMTAFSGALARRDGNPKSKYLAGNIEAVFRSAPNKTFNTKVTVVIKDSKTLRLRWEDVPVINASGRVVGTRVYSYTLTKQE